MANNYYDATGVLVLDTVTPVITALFGAFRLDGSHPGNGEAYIARIAEDNDPQWDDVCDALVVLAGTLGVPVPEGGDPMIERCLGALAKHFHVENDETLDHLIEHHPFEDSADLEALFFIATRFDDGHGLRAIRLEGCWHCDKPRLFEFGGQGIFISREFTHYTDSFRGCQLGDAIRTSLLAGDFDAVAARLVSEIAGLLNGIGDDNAREVVRRALARRLQADADPARHS